MGQDGDVGWGWGTDVGVDGDEEREWGGYSIEKGGETGKTRYGILERMRKGMERHAEGSSFGRASTGQGVRACRERQEISNEPLVLAC